VAVKVTKDYSGLKDLVDEVRRSFLKTSQEDIRQIIVEENIKVGLSPVNGEGKFQKYSDSYKKAIKAGRYRKFQKNIIPVSLKLSGDMLDSFFVKKSGNGLLIGFKDKLSDIHTNQGAGKSKVIRKMLPGSGEVFKPSVINKIIALLQDEIDRIVGKL